MAHQKHTQQQVLLHSLLCFHLWAFILQSYCIVFFPLYMPLLSGESFPTVAGEQMYTTFKMNAKEVWTLEIGVKGDSKRVSTVVVDKPYMGLLANETTSFLEPSYNKAGLNSCW
jgi:hypothetical protein